MDAGTGAEADAGALARAAVARTARESYGRLLAFLSARSRDLAAAEDALADAVRAALEHWPAEGVPGKPEAWLLTAARRRLLDGYRHAKVEAEAVPALLAAADRAGDVAEGESPFPDERLNLMFVCAHPAIDAAVRTPLMLQTVLGLDAERIASAFLLKPAAMGQRLSRAKAKIRDAGIAFALPGRAELPSRLEAVLEAIYAAFGSGWEDGSGADPRRRGLAAEALELGRLLARSLPGQPEALGLLALMLHCEARRPARRDARGNYVPLSEQDHGRWSLPMIEEADRFLGEAARAGTTGRFQLEALIQSAHAQRRLGGWPGWEEIAALYGALVAKAPTLGARLGQAAALAEARGAEEGWAALNSIPMEAVRDHQPYWALVAHLSRRLGRNAEAAEAYRRAIGLCEDPAARAFLEGKARELGE